MTHRDPNTTPSPERGTEPPQQLWDGDEHGWDEEDDDLEDFVDDRDRPER